MQPESSKPEHPAPKSEIAHSWGDAASAQTLIAPRSSDHKYRRGVVECITGSAQYPGAARLSVMGALRSGVGMVRYRNEDLSAYVSAQFPEVVLNDGRTDATLIGSGWPEPAGYKLSTTHPTVIDAAGLELVRKATSETQPRSWILTPHEGEFAAIEERLQLRGGSRSIRKRVLNLAAATQSTVLLKGSTTVIASPNGELVRVNAQSWRLATAGSGDVLAGLLAGLLAQSIAARSTATLFEIAATAAWLHQKAGWLASNNFAPNTQLGTQAPIIAGDLGSMLPRAIAEALKASA